MFAAVAQPRRPCARRAACCRGRAPSGSRSRRRSARPPRARAGSPARRGRAGRGARSSRSRRPSRARPRTCARGRAAFGGRWLIIRPFGWLSARTAGCRIASVTLRVSFSRGSPLAGMQAQLHPFELLEHVVGQVERAVAADVHLRAAENPKRRELLVDAGDLLGLPAQGVRVETGHDPDVRRVVADREILVASSRAAVAISRIESFRQTRSSGRADRRGCRRASSSVGGSARNGSSRSSGGHQGTSELRVDGASSSGAAGSVAECVDVCP